MQCVSSILLTWIGVFFRAIIRKQPIVFCYVSFSEEENFEVILLHVIIIHENIILLLIHILMSIVCDRYIVITVKHT